MARNSIEIQISEQKSSRKTDTKVVETHTANKGIFRTDRQAGRKKETDGRINF